MKELRLFKEAAAIALSAPNGGAARPPSWRSLPSASGVLSRYYCWSQSATRLFVAVAVPTGYADKALVWHATPSRLLVQAEDSLPSVDRAWWAAGGGLDPAARVHALVGDDHTRVALVLTKAEAGSDWPCLFEGDACGLRCLPPPYSLVDGGGGGGGGDAAWAGYEPEVGIEWGGIPEWVTLRDVTVDVTPTGLTASVRGWAGHPPLVRTFWRSDTAGGGAQPEAVDASGSSWALVDEHSGGDGTTRECAGRRKAVSISVARAARDARRGGAPRRDNRAHDAAAGRPHGARFFVEDEDAFGLEPLVAAMAFHAEGSAWVPASPHTSAGHTATREADLPKSVAAELRRLRDSS